MATTTIWGDLAHQIVECAGAGEVTTLMPIGTDPHDYSPSSQDVAAMVSADLVIANGLGLEEGLAQSIESAKSDGATVFEVAPQVDPLPFGAAADHGSQDPHVWHDVTRAAKASGLIGAELTKATGNPDYAECGTLLQGELMTVNDEVAATLAKVPEDRRDPRDRPRRAGLPRRRLRLHRGRDRGPGRVHPGRAELRGARGPRGDRQGRGRALRSSPTRPTRRH